MKTYDYINRVVITLPLTVYEGTWTNTLPSRCYVITMILRVRRKFFEITAFPNSIPMECLSGRSPDYSALRMFGCVCSVLLAPRERTKLTAQSVGA